MSHFDNIKVRYKLLSLFTVQILLPSHSTKLGLDNLTKQSATLETIAFAVLQSRAQINVATIVNQNITSAMIDCLTWTIVGDFIENLQLQCIIFINDRPC